MRHRSPRAALIAAAAAAAAVLAAALAMEHLLGVVPCALCLVERWPWGIALLLALLGLLVPRRLGWFALALAGLAVAGGFLIACVHVGVEAHLWRSPLPECTTPRFTGGSVAELLARMPVRPEKPCDSPTFVVPWLPLSTATLNLLASLAYALTIGRTLWRRGRRGR
jgi:disulfide bond formation protein DsbB